MTPKRVPHPRPGYHLSLLDLRITWQVPLLMTNPTNFLNQPSREDRDHSGKSIRSWTNLSPKRKMNARFSKEAPTSSLKDTKNSLQENLSKLQPVFHCHHTKTIWKGDRHMSQTWRKELPKILARRMSTSMWSGADSRWDRVLQKRMIRTRNYMRSQLMFLLKVVLRRLAILMLRDIRILLLESDPKQIWIRKLVLSKIILTKGTVARIMETM